MIVKQNFPRNRAALSLLSYCYYQMQDYKAATTMYEQLVKVCPSVEEYKVSLRGAEVQAKAMSEEKLVSRRSNQPNTQPSCTLSSILTIYTTVGSGIPRSVIVQGRYVPRSDASSGPSRQPTVSAEDDCTSGAICCLLLRMCGWDGLRTCKPIIHAA